MSSLNKILEDTLVKATGLKPADLGGANEINFSEEDKKSLISRLDSEKAFINYAIIAIIALHFFLFALTVYFVFYYQDSIKIVMGLLSGSGFSLMAIIYSLIYLVNMKIGNDLLRAILPNLPPDEAIKTVKSIYFKAKKNRWWIL